MAGQSFSLEKILLDKNLVKTDQLEKIKKEIISSGQTLRQAVVKNGIITEKNILGLISEAAKIPALDLATYIVDPEVIKVLPEDYARKYQIVPLFKIGGTLNVAVVEPLDFFALDDIRMKTGSEVEQVLVTESDLKNALELYYQIKGNTVAEVSQEVKPGLRDFSQQISTGKGIKIDKFTDAVVETPVVKIVNLILTEAVAQKASDIHIEPEEKDIKIRYRIDGIMYEVNSLEKTFQQPIITRLKVLSKMDISENRRPQDGQFRITYDNHEVDLRVSTFPTVNGENIVMRLLDKSVLFIGLEQIGFSKELLQQYALQAHKPHGIILVTGPTGSGKSTTLYATLQSVNDNTKNIITIEDPVEYQLENIRQSQVNVKAGVTFANGLRAILRQDPDVIMVGEIRDQETAEIAVQSALTGHLVFSTLHTNDAPSALTRLVDMGIEPFLISSSINMVLAQRLVRKICVFCKQPVTLDMNQLAAYKINPAQLKDKQFYQGKGCDKCHNSGYAGRMALFELMVVNEEVKSLIQVKAPSFKIKELIISKYGFEDLRANGIIKAAAGLTSLAEVLKVTQEE